MSLNFLLFFLVSRHWASFSLVFFLLFWITVMNVLFQWISFDLFFVCVLWSSNFIHVSYKSIIKTSHLGHGCERKQMIFFFVRTFHFSFKFLIKNLFLFETFILFMKCSNNSNKLVYQIPLNFFFVVVPFIIIIVK